MSASKGNHEIVSSYDILDKKIAASAQVVGVVGLGYVGLPLINAFTNAGVRCLGFDVDPKKINKLSRGESYIKHIPDGTIKEWIERETFEATSDMSRLSEADVVLICVPTPLSETRDPDLEYVIKTTEAIAETLRPGQLIVLESTTYPTTTRDVMLPILEGNASGLSFGNDFFLAYSPEREDPGNPDFTAARIPKVVGGCDEPSTKLACALYSQAIVKVVPVKSAEIAEACKILENTYRAVNIALVNELKVLFDSMDIDVWEVINAAKTKPFGYQAFYPGPGLGGHCIPIDPFYLSWLARRQGMQTRFIELAGEVNTRMPEYVIEKVTLALNEDSKAIRGSKIMILGMAYKRDVDDHRESPSFRLLEMLLDRGADVCYNDPHIPRFPVKRGYEELPLLSSVELTPEALESMDLVIIATNHSAYDYQFIADHASLVVDTRNATSGLDHHQARILKA
ncbi:MAG: nucleotide sugar dehydrogenase [Planctomycetota bacterium]